MKKLWLIAVAGLALSTSAAFAADLGQPLYKAPPPPPPPPSWTGFYIGANGGWGFNRDTGELFCEVAACRDAPIGSIVKPNGGLAGGQIGYNWQSGNIVVYGIEADIQWADIKDTASVFTGPALVDTYTASNKLDWFGTVRGRLGITPWNQALIYVTGGLIYGQEKVAASLESPPGVFSVNSDSTTRTGGTVGVGVEYLFTPNFSGKIEGLWYDMGSKDLFLTSTQTSHFHFEGAIVRAGLNWKFNWPGYEAGGLGGPGGPPPGQ